MSSYRKTILSNEQIYHVFNRGVEKRITFTDKREYERAISTLQYYQLKDLPHKFSRFLTLPQEKKDETTQQFTKPREKLVDIIAYCLMPNHFHLLLKQKSDFGITQFISKFTNSYTKYFNTKHDRVGPLFQGIFKSVWIEDDEQLLHVSRYIHLNPLVSFVVSKNNLPSYPWSSLPEYLSKEKGICETQLVLSSFSNLNSLNYKNFIFDQISYAKELEKIKHLILEN